jgi:hypothetical protein
VGIDGGRQAIQGIVDELGGPAEGIGLGGEAGDGVVGAGGGVAEGIRDRGAVANVRREARWEYSEATSRFPPFRTERRISS